MFSFSLPLANRMVEKMEKDGKMEQEQETMIYLMIRQLRKDWSGKRKHQGGWGVDI